MQDPYQILGVSRDASNDDIKKAYRTLSRKYHPDANINNPNKEQAEAKFRQVQEAYDQLINHRNDSTYGQYQDFRNYQSQSSSNDQDYSYMQSAASYINAGRYAEALNTLNNCRTRLGEWYYFSAVANSGLGNNITALEHAREALRHDPQNLQYQLLVARFQNNGGWYQNMRSPYTTSSVGGSGFCFKLFLANLVCNLCFGGSGFCCGSGGTYL